MGSVCKAEVQAYTSDACTADSLISDDLVSLSAGPLPCYSVQANTPLKGLTEGWIINQPGNCDPIQSKPNGTVKALESSAWEFCCADPDTADPDPNPTP